MDTLYTIIPLGLAALSTAAAIGWHFPFFFLSADFDLQAVHFDRTIRELTLIESDLRKVRRSKQRTTGPALCAEWQLAAMTFSEFEFEWLLVSQVWGSRGREFYRHRFQLSPYRREIQQAERQLSKIQMT